MALACQCFSYRSSLHVFHCFCHRLEANLADAVRELRRFLKLKKPQAVGSFFYFDPIVCTGAHIDAGTPRANTQQVARTRRVA